MLFFKNLLAIIALAMMFAPFSAFAIIMLYPFDLDVSVNSGGQDGLFGFRMFPDAEEYDPEFPFLDFSIQTSEGKGSRSLTYADGYFLMGDLAYNLTEIVPSGWKFANASCQAIRTVTIPVNNCDNIADENTECVPQYIETKTVIDGAFFAPIQNGISMRIPIQSGNISAKCAFVNTKENIKEKFVYVALGDSYQSGEGAGNSIADTADYLNNAYENGKNYPWIINGDPIGMQTNTYAKEVQLEGAGQGNGCHRALENYAKTIRDKLKPDADVILVDQTCSGAQIGTGDRDPIVGNISLGQIDPNSQTAKAIAQLSLAGLTPADVDLVTAGMGGNDAKFTDIVQACLLPNILRKVLQEYPDPPAEIKTLVDMFGSCENIDKTFFKSGDAINSLYDKEVWAQTKLLETFSHARVMQVNYPDILPKNTQSLAWCGGLRKEDMDYARKKIKTINKKIAQSQNAVAAKNPRLELVDVQNSLGGNPLCPPNSDNARVNGVNQANLNAEIRRLLNSDGNGDAQSRALVDKLVAGYGAWKQCWSVHLNLLDNGADCDTNTSRNELNNHWDDLLDYVNNKQISTKLFANLIASEKGGENISIRYDRSQGFFHPNLNGHKITACNVLAAYNHTDQSACLRESIQIIGDKVNGKPAGNAPVNANPGNKLHLHYEGFAPNTIIPLIILSVPKSLGTVTSDGEGVVDAEITLPDAAPGVHTIILEGTAAGGTGIAKQFRINYPGDAEAGGSYGIYFAGIAPANGDGDSGKVNIIYGNRIFAELAPDEEGGVFVEVPVFEGQGAVKVSAHNQTTGQTAQQTVQVSGDTAAPEITIASPEAKTYFNTAGLLPITYVAKDNSDSAPRIKAYLDDNEIPASAASINLGKYLIAGDHSLKIVAADSIGNSSEKIVTFKVAPKPLKLFSIKDITIKWSRALLNSKNKNPEFMISGRFELPDNFKKIDLSKSAIISLALPENIFATAKLNFKESGNLWNYRGGESLSNIKVNSALIYWAPEKYFCGKNKLCADELKNKNLFYIRGEITAGFSIDAQLKSIGVDFVLPLSPCGQKGSLAAAQTIKAQKLPWLWIYRPPLVWSYWKSDWWKSWDNYSL